MISTEAGYAEALMRAAEQSGSLRRVADELYVLAQAMECGSWFFYNPRVRSSAHIASLSALSGELDDLTLHFITLLASRRLLPALPAIQLHFDTLALRALGDEMIKLRLPYAPGERLLDDLVTFLAEVGLFPAEKREQLQVDVILDQKLLGGFCAEYAGREYDASLKRKLDACKRAST